MRTSTDQVTSSDVDVRDDIDPDDRPGGPDVRERIVERLVPIERSQGAWLGPFLAGVVTTLIAGAVATGVFLLVSDADDDGSVRLDAPAVDVPAEP